MSGRRAGRTREAEERAEARSPGAARVRRRRVVFGVVVLQLMLAASAMKFLPSEDADDDRPETAAVNEPDLSGPQALLFGVVTDQESKKPLAGAVITIDHAGGPTTVRTASDGRYRAVVDTSRPIGFTVDAPGYKGSVAFGKLCAQERRQVPIALASATSRAAPPAPLVLEEDCA